MPPPGGWTCCSGGRTHPPLRGSKSAPPWWVDLLQWRTHSPTGGGPPTAHGRWVPLHGGQGSISLEYQTCTSPHPFDTLVTGMVLVDLQLRFWWDPPSPVVVVGCGCQTQLSSVTFAAPRGQHSTLDPLYRVMLTSLRSPFTIGRPLTSARLNISGC